jgi:hypothetical protein
VTPKKGFNSAQLKEKALSVLRFNMPRYKVHVKMTR